MTVPGRWGLVTALMVVELVTVKLVATVVPNLTADTEMPGPLKLVPEMTTVAPPLVVPELGAKEVMEGAATGPTYL